MQGGSIILDRYSGSVVRAVSNAYPELALSPLNFEGMKGLVAFI